MQQNLQTNFDGMDSGFDPQSSTTVPQLWEVEVVRKLLTGSITARGNKGAVLQYCVLMPVA